MTLYKGPAYQLIKGGGAIGHHGGSGSNDEPSDQNWVAGTVMLISSCGSWAGFFILQVSMCSQLVMHLNILILLVHEATNPSINDTKNKIVNSLIVRIDYEKK